LFVFAEKVLAGGVPKCENCKGVVKPGWYIINVFLPVFCFVNVCAFCCSVTNRTQMKPLKIEMVVVVIVAAVGAGAIAVFVGIVQFSRFSCENMLNGDNIVQVFEDISSAVQTFYVILL